MLFSINEASQVAETKRAVVELARRLGFDPSETEKAAIVTTEIATNLLKHASGGQIVVRALEGCLELLALDRGPGMVNVGACLRDGYSTAGSPGNGLGAIDRLSTRFEIHSVPGIGTALLARLGSPIVAKHNGKGAFEVGVILEAKPGETACGDGWAVHQEAKGGQFLVVDGLGHGLDAAIAAQEAIRIFQQHAPQPLPQLLERMHQGLRHTRGAAMAIAEIDGEQQLVRFAGIGNIAGAVVADTWQRNMVSLAGIIGHEVRKIQEFTYPWASGARLVMHTDGLQSRWSLENYPGLSMRHPSLIAGVLYRDFSRGTDDVTLLIAK